jgi:hypothetical protein
MIALAVVLSVIAGGVALVWASRHLMIQKERTGRFFLTGESSGPPAGAPRVSVFVAARNEAACIEACVRSLLEQDYPNYELVVCNDRSTDETPRIVERLAAADGRLRLLSIDHLPEGWCGKNHAMQHGLATSDSEWICMTDADCRQTSRRTLSVAMQHALDAEADLLSVLPRLEMKGFWENVVQPVCSGVMMIWFHPDKVNDPARPNAYANGAFILIRRSAYEAIGTHEAVKDCLNEDMHMARRAKHAGLRLRVVRSEGLYVVRMYTSLRQIVRGWSRIFFGTFGTLRRLVLSLTAVVVMGLLPYAAAGLGLAMAAAAAPPAWAGWMLFAAACAAIVSQLSVIGRYYRLIGGRPGLFWTYPIGSLVTAAALIGSLTKLRRGARVVWKDTSYAQRSTPEQSSP